MTDGGGGGGSGLSSLLASIAALTTQTHNEQANINELEARVSRAEVIDIKTLSPDSVKFGATVKLADEDTGEDLTHLIAQSLGDKGENTILQAISSQPGITRSHLWSTPLPIHGWVGVCIRNLLAKGYIKERVDIDASGGLRRTYWITEKAPITE